MVFTLEPSHEWLFFALIVDFRTLSLTQTSETCIFSDVVFFFFCGFLHVSYICRVILLGWTLLISFTIVPTFLWCGNG